MTDLSGVVDMMILLIRAMKFFLIVTAGEVRGVRTIKAGGDDHFCQLLLQTGWLKERAAGP
jgi:hypothetical protein